MPIKNFQLHEVLVIAVNGLSGVLTACVFLISIACYVQVDNHLAEGSLVCLGNLHACDSALGNRIRLNAKSGTWGLRTEETEGFLEGA